jgi:hypothetical protein
MSARLKKMGPIGFMACVLGYLCWGYAGDPSAKPPAASDKKLEIPAALLSPTPAPKPTRDPFNSRAVDISTKIAAQAEKPTTTGASSAQAAAAPPRTPESVIAAAQGDLALQATHVGGERRVALINGCVYAEGDEIKSSGTTTRSYKVGRISPHRVEVQIEGQTVALTYSSAESKPRSPSPPGTAGQSAVKAKPGNTN